MSFLKKMFGKKDPVEEMRRCDARSDWAGVLSLADEIDRDTLDAALREEIAAWEARAGDALAAVNLEEGAWAQKSGNLLRAREDFQLARTQARSTELKERADRALAALAGGGPPRPAAAEDAQGPAVHAGCGSGCGSHDGAPLSPGDEDELDAEARLELLLATLPAELAERYLAADPAFRRAWLAAQDGDDALVAELLGQIPESGRDALFLFERGTLMMRGGKHREACRDLQAALALEPSLFVAFDALVGAMAALGQGAELERLLRQSLADGRFTGYCWARLAELHAGRQEAEPALAAGLKALEEGINDQGLLLLCAHLLERAGQADQAEGLLRRLPAGGCGGGVHPMLAEFWLRRGRDLDRALEAFKGALRQEQDNPRWPLRIAQVYHAKGWRKDAAEQVERLLRQGDLPQPLAGELQELAGQLQG